MTNSTDHKAFVNILGLSEPVLIEVALAKIITRAGDTLHLLVLRISFTPPVRELSCADS